MLIIGHPQFETQDDNGVGCGIPPIPEWLLDTTVVYDELSEVFSVHIDPVVSNVFIRLRSVFERARRLPLPPTRLHDLTCFVVHRLLLPTSNTNITQLLPISECIRYAVVLYMFIIQGPTYFSHAVIFNTMVDRLGEHFKRLESTPRTHSSLDVWLLAVGMVASAGTSYSDWFVGKARAIAASLRIASSSDSLVRIKSVLWLEKSDGEVTFRIPWDNMLGNGDYSESPNQREESWSDSTSIGLL